MSRKAEKVKYMDEVQFEMELRRYSQNTIRHYLCHIRRFSNHFNETADKLGENEIRLTNPRVNIFFPVQEGTSLFPYRMFNML